MMVTSNEMAGIAAQYNEIVKRVDNGSLRAANVREALQMIIEKKTVSERQVGIPDWATSPLRQIEKVLDFLELHGDGTVGFRPEDIPPVPVMRPRTTTEVLLLTVTLPDKGRVRGLQRTFDAWWDFIVPPVGIVKARWEDIKSDPGYLRQVSRDYTPGIRWVAFDPITYSGKSPYEALLQATSDGVMLAGVEVLTAAAMFPAWVLKLEGNAVNLPTLHIRWQSNRSLTIFIHRMTGDKLTLSGNDSYNAIESSVVSPSIREC